MEIKSAAWIKGLALQANLALDGFWKILQGVDPFEQSGVALPSLAPTLVPTATAVKFLKSWNDDAGNSYVYGHSDTKLYQVLGVSPFTVTDQTANIYSFAGMTGTPNKILGSIIYQKKYVYAFATSTPTSYIAAGALPVASGTDVKLLTSVLGDSSSTDYVPFCAGADGNLYAGAYQRIHLITSTTETSGNTAGKWSLDTGFTPRSIVNDGRYLVIIADNNAISLASRIAGKYKIKIYFWDMVKTQTSGTYILPDIVYDIDDSYAIGAEFMDGIVHVFGYNGFYECSAGSPPRMIRPFVGSSTFNVSGRPKNPTQSASNKGSIFWMDGDNGVDSQIWAYGNPVGGERKIFYQPYGNYGNVANAGALIASGTTFFASDSTPQILVYNTGTTRGPMRAVPTSEILSQPFTFGYTKVTLTEPLASGQTVTHSAISQRVTVISAPETKSYNAANPKQTLIFKRNAVGATNDRFEELQPSVGTTGGATVQRIAVFATPLDDANEDI